MLPLLLLFCLLSNSEQTPPLSQPFSIKFVDSVSELPIPLVEIRSAGNYWKAFSDSGGVVAFNEIGYMNDEVFFGVYTDGYELSAQQPNVQNYDPPYDSGILFNCTVGTIVILLDRKQVASRSYRLTYIGTPHKTLCPSFLRSPR